MFLKDIDLKDYTLIELDCNTRLWWIQKDYNKDNNGFEFISFQFESCTNEFGDDNEWNDTTEVELLFSGTAMFDGIRHMNFGESGSDGYSNYPDIEVYISILNELQKLVKQFCPQV